MAITLYTNGTQDISTPGTWDLAEVTGAGAFVGLLDFQHHDGLDVVVAWVSDDTGEATAAWTAHITVDTATPAGPVAVLTPPLPLDGNGRLRLTVTGTPGSPATVPWIIYRL